jgi:tellurite resistance protein
MALLHEAVEKKKMDVRMVERNVGRGVITQAEVDQAVKALPDDAENAIWVAVDSLMDDEGSGATHH